MKTILSLATFLALALASTAHPQGILYSFEGVGDSVAAAGDVDGDGRPDLLLGHRGPPGRVELRSGASGIRIHVLTHYDADDGYAMAVAGIGDVDLDGTPDFAVSAPLGASQGSLSFVRVHSGATGLLLYEVQDTDPLVQFGRALAGGSDANGDGVPDLIVGVPRLPGAGGAGQVRLLDGRNGALLLAHVGAGPSAAGFGSAVVFAGDLDLDGRADYAAGSGIVGTWLPGALDAFSGASGAKLFSLAGGAAGDAFGAALGSIGDVDGDGVADLAIGVPGEPQSSFVKGAVRVISGASGSTLHHVPSAGSGLLFGSSVAGVGDVDGDGVPDFAAHFPLAYIGGVFKNFGSARILSGASGSLLASWTLGYLGPIASAGDVNLDGAQDLLIAGGVSAFSSSLVLGNAPQTAAYCTAKTNSLGCLPALYWTGGPSLSTGPGLTVRAKNALSQKVGFLLWGSARAAKPFAGGTLCVAPPLVRTPLQTSGGPATLDCSGSYAFTFGSAYLAQHGLAAGSTGFAQMWSRDPGFTPPGNVGLTNAVAFTVWP